MTNKTVLTPLSAEGFSVEFVNGFNKQCTAKITVRKQVVEFTNYDLLMTTLSEIKTGAIESTPGSTAMAMFDSTIIFNDLEEFITDLEEIMDVISILFNTGE
jgi:hypothetical protein